MNDKMQGHCPSCGGERNADVVASYKDEDEGWVDSYFILKCGGCGEVYFRHDDMWNTVEDPKFTIEYWPAPAKRKHPSWIWEIKNKDAVLGDLVTDIYRALDHDLRPM